MNNNDSATKLTQALEEMKREQGERFSLDKINLSELSRRTGISRKKLRRLKENGFKEKPHGLTGRKAAVTVLTGFTGIIDDLLRKGVYNSAVIHECPFHPAPTMQCFNYYFTVNFPSNTYSKRHPY